MAAGIWHSQRAKGLPRRLPQSADDGAGEGRVNVMPELRFAHYRNEFKYTHYLFRFPAKFHPPVVRCLIDRYSRPGDIILDPFCGSGTLLLEALLSGRAAFGLDVDPVAVFISRVKCTPLPPLELEGAFEVLKEDLQRV